MTNPKPINNSSFTFYRYKILPYAIIVFLYTLGRFAFFDLFGIRRPVQLLFLCFVIGIGIPKFLRGLRNILKFPQAILLLVLSFFLIINGHKYLIWLDTLLSFFIVTIILDASKKFIDVLSSSLIRVTLVLSVMGLFQFALMVIYPPIIDMISLQEGFYLSDTIMISNPFMLLGLGTGDSYVFGGIEITRLKSFLYEPSLIPAYFGIPCALAFADEKKKLWTCFMILLFIVITFAGNSYVFLVGAVLTYILLKSRQEFVAKVFPYLACLVFAFLVVKFIPPTEVLADIKAVIESSELSGTPAIELSGGAQFKYTRQSSMLIRLGMLHGGLAAALENMFTGVDHNLASVLGIFIYSLAYAGIAGLVISCFFAYKLFAKIIALYNISGSKYRLKISAALLYSIYLQAFIYNDYGFTTTYGMSVIALTYRKISEVADDSQ